MAVLRYSHKPSNPQSDTTTQQISTINNTVSSIQSTLEKKVTKSSTKGLSENNYSTPEKNKLHDIEDGAEVNVLADWNETDTTSDSYILNKPDVPILDPSGLIPAAYLPSYVDDVLEYNSVVDFPAIGEKGKIYVDTSTDITYRWSGSTYIEISKSIVTGVKGDAEANYRIGNINLTAANIGLGKVVNLDQSKAIKTITRSDTTFTYTCLDGTTGTFTLQDTVYSLPLAANGTRGGILLGFTQSGRNYPVQLSGEKAYVNVPWTDTTYTLPLATSSARGGVKVGFTTSAANRNYAVLLSNELMYVNVPWTDTNTTYTFTDANPTLAWSTKSKVATVGGVDIHVTMPANPNTDTNTWRPILCNGTSIGSNTLNLKAGSNVSLSNSNGAITITSTDTNTWRGIQDNLTSSTNTTESLSAKQGYLLANGSARDNTKLPLAGGTLTGKVNVNSSYRNAGMYGVYDSHYLGHIWSIGTSYAISADGKDPATLYGLAYFHTNWSNDATYNTNAANKTAIGTYAAGHQVGWFANGILLGSIGNYIWSKNGFIKNGSSNSYTLLGGGGHKALSDFITTSNISSQSVSYATSAGSVAWSNVTGKPTIPTKTSQLTNDSGYITSSSLSGYLPLTGGTLTGQLTISNDKYISVTRTGRGVTFGSGTDTYVGGDTTRMYVWLGKNLPLVFGTNGTEQMRITNGGVVSIGSSNPPPTTSYKLYVSGNAYLEGNVSATTCTSRSDLRLKDIQDKSKIINIEDIANAPVITFKWKNKDIDEDVHVGTSAQYWNEILPEAVSVSFDDYLSMDYGAAALSSAITIARKTVEHEEKIKQLEDENKQLKEELLLLKSQIKDILTVINAKLNDN